MNLTAFQHSPFLQSLGWAIANSLWQAAALWLTYLLIVGIYKDASAKFKNNLSVILMCSSFVWFCITLFSKYFAIHNFGNYNITLNPVNNAASAYNWDKLLNNVAWILPYLSIAYLLLLLFFSVRLINIYRFTGFIKVNGLQKPGVEWKLFADKVARQMGITKNIKLWVSRHIDVPATIGFLKPVILIPLASINQLSVHQLEAIILHELSHIKRNDYLINLFISIIETILFFNPFVVLMAKIIKRERENCCDDFVIQYQYDRHTYASALLSLEQYRSLNLKLVMGATSGKKQLLLRIKRIMEINNSTNFNYGQKLAALLLITGVMCSVAWLSPNNINNDQNNVAIKSIDIPNKKDQKNINKVETFRALFDNPSLLEEKTLPLKAAAKKIANKVVNQLKDLEDLNQKELAALQNSRINLIFEGSKKQIPFKKSDRHKINNLFAHGSNFFPTLFYNKFSDVSYGTAAGQLNFFNGQINTAELQKLQKDIEKAGFNFTFNAAEPEAAVKHLINAKEITEAFNSKEFKELFNARLIKATELKKGNEADHVSRVHEKANLEKEQKRIYVRRIPKTSANGGTQQSVYMIDTLITAEIAAAESHATNVSSLYRTYTIADARPPENENKVYSYGFTVNELVNHGHKIKSQGINNKPAAATSKGNSKAIIVPGTQHFNRTPGTNCPPVKTAAPTPPQHREDVRIEFKNGVIVINGKKLEVLEQELIALSLKGKRNLTKTKNLRELYIED